MLRGFPITALRGSPTRASASARAGKSERTWISVPQPRPSYREREVTGRRAVGRVVRGGCLAVDSSGRLSYGWKARLS